MAKDVIHISEAEAASDFASLMARVRSGTEVVIEDNARRMRTSPPQRLCFLPDTSRLFYARVLHTTEPHGATKKTPIG